MAISAMVFVMELTTLVILPNSLTRPAFAETIINIGVGKSDNPNEQQCKNILGNISWKVSGDTKVNIILFKIPEMKYISDYENDMKEMRGYNFSGVIHHMSYPLAMLTEFLHIPYLLLSYAKVTAPPHSLHISTDFSQIGQAVHDLTRYLQSYHAITFIIDDKGHQNAFEVFNFFPGENINFFSVEFNNTKEPLREQMLHLAGLRPTVPTDVYVIILSDAETEYIAEILKAAFYAGLASSNQLWIIPSIFVQPDLLAPFRFANARIVTFSAKFRNTKNLQMLEELSCESSVKYIIHAVESDQSVHTATHPPTAPHHTVDYITQLHYLSPSREENKHNEFEEVGTWTLMKNWTGHVEISRRISQRPEIIKVGVFELKPYFIYLKDGTAGGYTVDLFKNLEVSMNVKFEWVVLKNGHIGRESGPANASNGLIGMLLSGEIDVSGIPMIKTKELLKIMDVSEDLHVDGVSLLQYIPSKPINWHLFVNPFSLAVWCTWGITFIILTVSLFTMETISPNTTRRGARSYRLSDIIFLTFTSLIITKLKIIPQMLSTRIFVLLLWFASLIVVSSYTSNMVPFFVRWPETSVINNFEALYNARGMKQWFWVKDSDIYRSMNDEKSGITLQLVEYAEDNWRDKMFEPDMESAIRRLKSDTNTVLFVTNMIGTFLSTSDCKLKLGKEVMLMSNTVLGFRPNWPLRQNMLNGLMTLSNNRDLQRIYERWLTGSACLIDHTLYWQDVFPGFLILGVGVIISIVAVICERVTEYLRPAMKGCCQKNLKVGHVYKARVDHLEKKGAFVSISRGTNRKNYFIPSVQLILNALNYNEDLDATMMGLKRRDWIELKYVGKHPMNKQPYLVRTLSHFTE